MASVFDGVTKRLIVDANTPDYVDGGVRYAVEPSMPPGVEHRYVKVVPGRQIEFKGELLDTGDVVEMTQEEKDAVDCPDLAAYKQAKRNAIDDRTSVLIEQGFTYVDKLFSTSLAAQKNLIFVQQSVIMRILADLVEAAGIRTPETVAMMRLFQLPHKMSTKDNNVEHELADELAVLGICATAAQAVMSPYATGRALNLQVMEAVDKAEVDAIEDNR